MCRASAKLNVTEKEMFIACCSLPTLSYFCDRLFFEGTFFFNSGPRQMFVTNDVVGFDCALTWCAV